MGPTNQREIRNRTQKVSGTGLKMFWFILKRSFWAVSCKWCSIRRISLRISLAWFDLEEKMVTEERKYSCVGCFLVQTFKTDFISLGKKLWVICYIMAFCIRQMQLESLWWTEWGKKKLHMTRKVRISFNFKFWRIYDKFY